MQVDSRWSLVEELGENKVVVACECGRSKTMKASAWEKRTGLNHKCPFEHELIGEAFGRLTVIAPLQERKRGNILFQCACECGQETQAIGSELRRGNVRSCGCLQREIASERGKLRFPKAGDYISYGYAHNLVKKAKGAASDYDCVSCGSPAAQWAYDGQDPEEIRGMFTFIGMAYSTKPEHYMPLCIACHRAFDSGNDITINAQEASL